MDAATRKIALVILGLIALVIVAGGIWLQNDGTQLADAFIALGGVAVGAIAGIITPERTA